MANPAALALAKDLERRPRACTRRELESSWSRSAFKGALGRGLIAQIVPGVYAATAHADSLLIRAHAAHVQCGPGSVVIGVAAASIWGLCDPPRTVTVAVPYGVKVATAPWLTLRRLAPSVPSAWWYGCPIARPDWAAVTAYASSPPQHRDRFLYRVVQSRKATPADIRGVVAQLARIRGRAHIEQVLLAIDEGCESHLEMQGLRRVFNTREFDGFVRQHWVRTTGGNFRLDMFHPPSRTAVELDGTGTHGRADTRQDDISRDVHVAGLGILTLRLSSTDIEQRPEWCRAGVRAVIASRL